MADDFESISSPLDDALSALPTLPPIPAERTDSNGIASTPGLPTFAEYVDQNRNAADLFSMQEEDVTRLVLTPPRIKIPDFASKLVRANQYNYERLMTATHDSGLQAEVEANGGVMPAGLQAGRKLPSAYLLAQSSATAAMGTYQFHRAVTANYMRKMLSLTYHQNTTLGTISTNFIQLGKVLENKLEAIKLNTGAPDAKKASALGMIKAEFRRQWTASTVDTVRKGLASYTKPRLNKFVIQPLSRKTSDFFSNKNDLNEIADSARNYVSSLLSKTVSEIKTRADNLNEGRAKTAVNKVADAVSDATDRLKAYTPSEKTQDRARRISASIRNILPSSSISDMINSFMDNASGEVVQTDSLGNPLSDTGPSVKRNPVPEPDLQKIKPGLNSDTPSIKIKPLLSSPDDYQNSVISYLSTIADTLEKQLDRCCCGTEELPTVSKKRSQTEAPKPEVEEDTGAAEQETDSPSLVERAQALKTKTVEAFTKKGTALARKRIEPRVWNDAATRAAMAIPTAEDVGSTLFDAASKLRASHVDAHTWNNTLTELASKIPETPTLDTATATAQRVVNRAHRLSERYINPHTWNDLVGKAASLQPPTKEDLRAKALSATQRMKAAVESLQPSPTTTPENPSHVTSPIGGYLPYTVTPALQAAQTTAAQTETQKPSPVLPVREPLTAAENTPPVSEKPTLLASLRDRVENFRSPHISSADEPFIAPTTPRVLEVKNVSEEKVHGLLISVLNRLEKKLDREDAPTPERTNDYHHLLDREHHRDDDARRDEEHRAEQAQATRTQSGLLGKLLHAFEKDSDDSDSDSSKKKGLLDSLLDWGSDDSGGDSSEKRKTRKERRAERRASRAGRKRRFRLPKPTLKGVRGFLSRRPHLPEVKSGRLGYRVGGAIARGVGGLVKGGLGVAGWGLRNVVGPALGMGLPVVGKGLLGAAKLGGKGLWGATKFASSGLFGLGSGLLGLGGKAALGSASLLGKGAWGGAKLLGKGAWKLGKTKMGLMGLGALGADMLTDHFTQKGSLANRLGKTASSAASWAAMGSMFGPWGTAIGGVLGGLMANTDLLSGSIHYLGKGMTGAYHAIVGDKAKVGPDGKIIPGGDGLWGRIKHLFSFTPAAAATTGTMAANASAAMADMHNLATQQSGGIIANNPNNPSGFSGSPTMPTFDPTGLNNFAASVGGMLDKQKITDQKAYKDIITKLPKGLVDRAAKSEALQFTIWSTATQLGTERAAKILSEQYGDKENDHEYLRKVYQMRSAQFGNMPEADRLKGMGQVGNEQDYAMKLDSGGAFKFTEAASIAGAPTLAGGDASVFGNMNIASKKESLSSEEQFRRAKHAIAFFMSKGWSKEQALGIVANLIKESGLSPGALNPDGVASGLAQWRKARQKDIQQQFGVPSVFNLGFDGQLAAVDWELTAGPYKNVGDQLKKLTSVADAVKLVSDKYEIPSTTSSGLAEEAQSRMATAARLIKSFNNDSGSSAYWAAIQNGSSDPQSGTMTASSGAPAQNQTQNQTAQASQYTTPVTTETTVTDGSSSTNSTASAREAAASQIAANYAPTGPSTTQDPTAHALLKTISGHLATQNDHLAAIRQTGTAPVQTATAAPSPSVVQINRHTTNVHVDSKNQLHTDTPQFSEGLT